MYVQNIMSKPNEYGRFGMRWDERSKSKFEQHAEKKGYAIATLIKKLIEKELKENIIPPKDC